MLQSFSLKWLWTIWLTIIIFFYWDHENFLIEISFTGEIGFIGIREYAKGKNFTYIGKECNNGGTKGNDDETSVTSCKFIFWKIKEKETKIIIITIYGLCIHEVYLKNINQIVIYFIAFKIENY